MPNVRLPTITSHDLASHRSEKSCYVTVGANVYDITSFLIDHPGGGGRILEYGGKDVSEIMGDAASHVHSEVAYDILNENIMGFVAKEAAIPAVVKHHDPAEDLTKETDLGADFVSHNFLDLKRPLLAQVWNGGFSKEFYLEQVHRPRYYSKGDAAPLFGNFLEPLSKATWWIGPVIWLPLIVYGTYLADLGLPRHVRTAEYWLGGFLSWPLVEYGVHRFVGHLDNYLPDTRLAITTHFLIHGLHHYLPMDKYRLSAPPLKTFLLTIPIYKLVHSSFYWDWHAATAVFCGGFFGYIYYEVMHYFLHHKTLPAYYKQLKRYHLQHHYADYENGFGVTTQFWDWVFGTELSRPIAAKAT